MTKEKMFEEIMKNITESYLEEEPLEGVVSRNFLGNLTGMDITNMDESDIIDNEEYLNKSYGHIAAMYGFHNFYDLYLFATANDEHEAIAKAGQKEFSRLKKVKRTVIRNGRPTVMTFYEDPSKGSGDEGKNKMDSKDAEAEEPQEPQQATAGELPANIVGDFQKPVKIRNLKLLRKLHEKMGAKGEFNADADQYTVLTDEEGNPRGVIGIKRDGNYLSLNYVESDSYTTSIEVRAFYTLIAAASRGGFGAKVLSGDKMMDSLAQDSDMELVGNTYVIEHEDLLDIYGELP